MDPLLFFCLSVFVELKQLSQFQKLRKEFSSNKTGRTACHKCFFCLLNTLPNPADLPDADFVYICIIKPILYYICA